MASIFISYRREDSRADTGRLYDHLSSHFGAERVFMDIDDIAPGADFVDVLDRTLAGVDILLVVIGPRWLAPDNSGRRRLDDERDFVRTEIERGLARGAAVIPVLVGGTTMPARETLPPALGALSQRQSIEISDSRFREDVERLIAAIESRTGSRTSPRTLKRHFAVGAALLIALLVGALAIWRHEPRLELRSAPATVSGSAYNALLARYGFYDARANAAGTGIGNRFEQRIVGEDVVVVDHRTGLSWEQGGSGFWNATVIGETTRHLDALNERRYGGHADWRLPTLAEALSLVTPGTVGDYHIAGVFDAREAPQMFTADKTADGAVWIVYFYEGMALPESPTYNAWTRAVRGPD